MAVGSLQAIKTEQLKMAAVIASILAVVALDFAMPLGLAIGVSYTLPILLSFIFFAHDRRKTFVIAVVAVALLILKYLWNLQQGVGFWSATINRSISAFTMVSVYITLSILHSRGGETGYSHALKTFSIRKKFLAISLGVLAVFMFSFAITSSLFLRIEKEQNDFETDYLRPLHSLQRVREFIGFGCGIHAFKNYVLRGDESYYDRAKDCFHKALAEIQDGGFQKTFPESIADVGENIESYLAMLEVARGVRSSRVVDIAKLDAKVRVDDRAAVKALDFIETQLNEAVKGQVSTLQAAAKQRGAVIFVTFLVAFVFLYAVVSSLSTNIDRSIVNLAHSAERIADGFLAEPVERLTDDEMGDLASSLDVMRAKLKANLESLANSNRDLEQFAYVASHDLQEPLRKIMAFGSRLETSLGTQMDEKSREYLQKVLQSSGRMRVLIDDLLAYSRVTTQDVEEERVDLNQLLKEITEDLEVRIREGQAQVHSEELPVVRANATHMRQLFQNLLANALKFRKKNEPARVEVWARPASENRVRITVKDNGIGFDMKYVDKIILPFQTLHNRQEYGGTGIGLAISHKIVTRHGGRFDIRSVVDVGSEFSFDLKLDS